MSISVEQYRYAIGLHSINMFGKRSVSSGMNYFTLKLNKILRQLLSTSHKPTDHFADRTFEQLLIGVCTIMFLNVILILMIITLGMVIEISMSARCVVTVPIIRSPEGFMPMPLLQTLVNWSVLLHIFSHSFNNYLKAFPVLYYIAKRKFPKNLNIPIWDNIAKLYVLYIGIINLLLIVIVTPSIVNPGPTSSSMSHSPSELKIAYCNMQGIIMMSSMRGTQPIFQTNKLLDFQNYLHMNKPDIVLVNESWLNEHINSNEIVNENYYKCFRLDRSIEDKTKYGKVGGGGVFSLVRQGLNISTKLVAIDCDIPILSIEVKFDNSSKICISTFYRYGYSSNDTFESAQAYYRELSRRYNKIVVIGDLNLSTVEDWDDPYSTSSLENSYIDLFNDLGLKCLINTPTHNDGNILDLLLTNQPGLIKNLSIDQDLICPSDHFSITFTIKKNISKKKFTKKKVFKYTDADWDGFSEEIMSYNWCMLFKHKTISEAWNLFKSKLDISMRKYIPMKSVKFRHRPPWFDSEIF